MFEVRARFPMLSGESFAWEACDDKDCVRLCQDGLFHKPFCPFGVQICDVFMEDLANFMFQGESACEGAFFSCMREDDRETSDCLCRDVCRCQPCEEFDNRYA